MSHVRGRNTGEKDAGPRENCTKYQDSEVDAEGKG